MSMTNDVIKLTKMLEEAMYTLSIISSGNHELSYEKIENEYKYYKKIAHKTLIKIHNIIEPE